MPLIQKAQKVIWRNQYLNLLGTDAHVGGGHYMPLASVLQNNTNKYLIIKQHKIFLKDHREQVQSITICVYNRKKISSIGTSSEDVNVVFMLILAQQLI